MSFSQRLFANLRIRIKQTNLLLPLILNSDHIKLDQMFNITGVSAKFFVVKFTIFTNQKTRPF